MSGHEFLLPDELGWKCADEVGLRISKAFEQFSTYVLTATTQGDAKAMWEVIKAECADDIYAIIKKYQNEK